MTKSNATQLMLQLQNLGINTSSICTHHSNPNQPTIALTDNGISIKVKDSPLPEFVNYYNDTISNYDSDNSNAYSLITHLPSPPELPMLSTPPSYTTLPAELHPKTSDPYGTLITQLEEKLTKLSLDNPKPLDKPFLAPKALPTKDSPEDYAFTTHFLSPNDNPTIEEALLGLHKEKWMEVMREEVLSLVNLKMFELTNLPPRKNLIGCKWVLTIKQDEKGEIS
ncbi:hypothetical protein OPQ81_005267 [Rhizoctonia solani]|nr:hypothetical protein OPQ81_005267 [Rhizoctonia solani]